jgi:hypothetical protein
MPKGCEIVDCHNNHKKNPDLSFYLLPNEATEPERRVRWLVAIGRGERADPSKLWSPKSEYHYVCSAHFISGKSSLINY